MFRLEVHGDLGYGEDAEGGDEGGHQVVLIVTSQTEAEREVLEGTNQGGILSGSVAAPLTEIFRN